MNQYPMLPIITDIRRAAKILSVFSAALLVFIVSTGIVYAAPSTDRLSKEDAKQLLQQGVALYEKKDLAGAQKALEQAEALLPENYVIPYYLGLIYLNKGSRAGAIFQWRKYLRLDPYSDNANHIRKLLTLLLCDEATEKAKAALARENTLTAVKADDNSIAVTAYKNLGSAQLNPLGKGIAAMLISDLAKVPDLKVVDRIQLQALMHEMKIGTSGLVNAQTAPRLGRMLKVGRVNTGSFSDIGKKQLQIAAVTIDAQIEEPLDSRNVQGSMDDFYKLEKRIACGILKSMDIGCDTAPKAFHKVHTKSLPAFVAYCAGLDYFDRKRYDDARKQFQKALKDDPEFDLAREALVATPLSAMLVWNTSQIISSASANGIPSAALGSATATTATTVAAGSATAGTAAGSAAADTTDTTVDSESGLSTSTIAIAAGAAAVTVIALAAGGGGGGGGEAPYIQEPLNTSPLSGDWTGTWTEVDADGTTAGDASVSLKLTQNDNVLGGTVSVPTAKCFQNAQVNGTVSANNISLNFSYDTGTAHFEGTYDDASMSGTVNYLSGNCAGEVNYVSLQKLSSADISW